MICRRTYGAVADELGEAHVAELLREPPELRLEGAAGAAEREGDLK